MCFKVGHDWFKSVVHVSLGNTVLEWAIMFLSGSALKVDLCLDACSLENLNFKVYLSVEDQLFQKFSRGLFLFVHPVYLNYKLRGY